MSDFWSKFLFCFLVLVVICLTCWGAFICINFIDVYNKEVLNGVHTYDYFKNNLSEFEIIDFSIGYTRYGSPTFTVFTKHVPTQMYYDYQVSYDNYMRLNKLVSGDSN